MYTREELKLLKKEFWESFSAYCSIQPFMRAGKRKWILYNTKIKGFEFKFDATGDGAFVILELNHKNEDVRLEMFEKLLLYKGLIEKLVDKEEVVWDFMYIKELGEEVARVYVQKTGIDIRRKSDWGCFFRFMYEKMLAMEKVFQEIKDVFLD